MTVLLMALGMELMLQNKNNRTVLVGTLGDPAPRTRINQLAFVIASLLMFLLLCLHSSIARAEVEGNCTMCHKYPGLGRIEKSEGEDGKTIKRLFYLNNELFESTYHGKIRCKNCHTGVEKIPHTDAPPVNCAADCHILDPSSNKAFSHKKIVDDFNASVHGKDGSHIDDKSQLPVCKDCHNNKTYHTVVAKEVDSLHKVIVCTECHQSKEFVQRFYEHIIYNSTKRRSSRDVIKLCSTCHADLELMQKAKLDPVIGFTTTFHAKAIKFGNEEVANCLNCHAPYELGFSPHRITSNKDKNSPVSKDNKIKTCRQSGCHTDAAEEFALGSRVHPSPERIRFLTKSEMQKLSEPGLFNDPAFQTRVVGWIQTFYKILIVVVIGGLGLHRILAMYAHRREQRARSKST